MTPLMSESSGELVSVVIPVYNGAAYLGEAVESVRRQTWGPTEIVIVDDGSTDDTPRLATSMPGVRYVRQENAGPAAAINRGVALAEGALISFLSADDVWVPGKLELQRAALAADPAPTLVFGHMQHFLSPELDPDTAASLRCPPDPMPAYSAGTLLARLDVFRTVGPLDERYRVGEFMDWYGRASDQGLRIQMLPEVLSRRRVHAANHSLKAKATQGYARVLKAALDRRRREGQQP